MTRVFREVKSRPSKVATIAGYVVFAATLLLVGGFVLALAVTR